MRSEYLYLLDMIQAADTVEEFVHDVSEKEFIASRLLQSAVVYQLSIIGEAASKVSPEIQEKYPDVVWKSVKNFRNIAIHGYSGLVWSIVWATANISAPLIRFQVNVILDAEYSDRQSPDNGM